MFTTVALQLYGFCHAAGQQGGVAMTDHDFNHIRFSKPLPKTVAVFGASGRIGRQVANYLGYLVPDTSIRLLASTPAGAASLQRHYPGADVRVASYLSPDTLRPALDGAEAVFIVTPPGMDEQAAMGNLVSALVDSETLIQAIRLVGVASDWPSRRFPFDRLRTGGEHYIARDILEESGLPVTYVNLGASLLDNLLMTAAGIRASRTLIWPERWVPVMDVRDLGEVIALLFISSERRYIGSFLTLNNGYDYVTTQQLAEAMSDAFLTPIAHKSGREDFLTAYGALLSERFGSLGQAEDLLDYFEWEHENWLWQPNDTAERILGRRPNTLHSWLLEHAPAFLPASA